MSDQYGPQPGHPAQPAYAQQAPPQQTPPQQAPPQQALPQQGYPVQQYGYPVPQYAPPAPRPPLTREQRNGAMLAGGIGFTMFSLGAGAAFVIVLLGFVVSILAAVFGFIGMNSAGEAGFAAFQSFLDSFPVGIVVAVGIVAFFLAVALMVGGILLSIRIMKKRGINNAVAVTWSGLGIAVVGSWIVSSFVSFVPSVFGSMVDGVFEAVVAGFSAILALALYVAVGVFVWWWMAHTMRARIAG